MNVTEHLLSCLGEEGSEIGQVTSKINRFGINDRYKDYEPLVIRLAGELNDLLGVVELLVADGVLPKNWRDRTKIVAKKRKVIKHMKRARENGALK